MVNNEYVFVIDPIDGTTNFMQDYRCSCISVALCNGNDVVAGVVYKTDTSLNVRSIYNNFTNSTCRINFYR